ncbi:hypothetical protein SESBI_45580 [Sesbania bispinosa]|nr:hypothetical protein SESBI_45580 [Sesbania bispinosa]
MREGVHDSDFLQPRRGPHSAVAVMAVLISCSGRLVMGEESDIRWPLNSRAQRRENNCTTPCNYRSVGKLHFAVAVVDPMAVGSGFVMVIAGGGHLDLRW